MSSNHYEKMNESIDGFNLSKEELMNCFGSQISSQSSKSNYDYQNDCNTSDIQFKNKCILAPISYPGNNIQSCHLQYLRRLHPDSAGLKPPYLYRYCQLRICIHPFPQTISENDYWNPSGLQYLF